MNLQSRAMNMVPNAASVGGRHDGGAIMSTDKGGVRFNFLYHGGESLTVLRCMDPHQAS